MSVLPRRVKHRFALLGDVRYAPFFDGVTQYGVLAQRAIDPDGDIDIEFYKWHDGIGTIVAQNINGAQSEREFQLWQGAGKELQITIGGESTFLASVEQGYTLGSRYYLKVTGNTATLAKDSVSNVISSRQIVRGAIREPLAITTVMARTNGSVGSVSVFSGGLQYYVKINGTTWPMATRNNPMQPSIPAGNPLTIINHTDAMWRQV